jgi:hypothetical protein
MYFSSANFPDEKYTVYFSPAKFPDEKYIEYFSPANFPDEKYTVYFSPAKFPDEKYTVYSSQQNFAGRKNIKQTKKKKSVHQKDKPPSISGIHRHPAYRQAKTTGKLKYTGPKTNI